MEDKKSKSLDEIEKQYETENSSVSYCYPSLSIPSPEKFTLMYAKYVLHKVKEIGYWSGKNPPHIIELMINTRLSYWPDPSKELIKKHRYLSAAAKSLGYDMDAIQWLLEATQDYPAELEYSDFDRRNILLERVSSRIDIIY